jgi:hypothetical protein
VNQKRLPAFQSVGSSSELEEVASILRHLVYVHLNKLVGCLLAVDVRFLDYLKDACPL